MIKRITISKDVSLPIELTTRRSAVFGISGSGKSNTATVCIEQLLDAGEQVVLIDPKGEGWGLQTSASGKSAGYNVIVFGQPRGDIEDLREEHAEQIADFVVDSGRSVVLSLLGFDSDQAERRFVTGFFSRLYRRKSQQAVKTRTLVVLEEAHLFIPEQASGNTTTMVGAIKRIARQGRSAGLGLMLVDQRPQDVAKSVLTQCELLICHQLVHKLDRAALNEWIRAYDREDQGETFLASLAELQPGEAWVWSPAWLQIFTRTKVARRSTYDSGATPDGSPAAAPKAKANVDLDQLRTHLAKVVEEQKANDPAELKKRIRELEQKVATTAKTPATVAKPVDRPVPVLTDEDRVLLKELAQAMQAIPPRIQEAVDQLTPKLAEVGQAPVIPPKRQTMPKQAPVIPATRPSIPRPSSSTAPSANGELSPRLRQILSVFAQRLQMGKETTSPRIVAARVAMKRGGGGFNNYLSQLRTSGYLEGTGDAIRVTQAGLDALGPVDPLPTGQELLDLFKREHLSEKEGQILDQVVAAYPKPVDKLSLAESIGMTAGGGGFNNYLSHMRSLGLITSGEIRATEELMEGVSSGGP